MNRYLLGFAVFCSAVALVPCFPSGRAEPPVVVAFPGWPSQWDGRTLMPLPLTPREHRFARGFPGRIARFTDGQREIILRWVTRETRALHSAADCFRGLGYDIHPLPLATDKAGRRWGQFRAVRGNDAFLVSERVYTPAGTGWTDVSAWYWSALWGATEAPWWAVTVAERSAVSEPRF